MGKLSHADCHSRRLRGDHLASVALKEHQIKKRHAKQQAAAQAYARGRALTVFLVIAFVFAGYVLHREKQLNQQDVYYVR